MSKKSKIIVVIACIAVLAVGVLAFIFLGSNKREVVDRPADEQQKSDYTNDFDYTERSEEALEKDITYSSSEEGMLEKQKLGLSKDAVIYDGLTAVDLPDSRTRVKDNAKGKQYQYDSSVSLTPEQYPKGLDFIEYQDGIAFQAVSSILAQYCSEHNEDPTTYSISIEQTAVKMDDGVYCAVVESQTKVLYIACDLDEDNNVVGYLYSETVK